MQKFHNSFKTRYNSGFYFLYRISIFLSIFPHSNRNYQMKHLFSFLLFTLTFCLPSIYAQRTMEKLDRGFIAIPSASSDSVYLSWRFFGTDPANIAFNIYKNNSKLNTEPITGSTNFVDASGGAGTYTLKTVLNDTESAASESPIQFLNTYLSIPLVPPPAGVTPADSAYTYGPNDCSVADLDGDGAYEIILKWDPTNSHDNSEKGYTGNVFLDAYKLNGTRLWRIDLGRNIRAGAHYTQFMVYDLAGDGHPVVVCKTADGTVDGKGVVIGSASADYRNSSGYVLSGPEYLTVFDGKTGAAITTVDYDPPRGTVSSWGDSYGNRVDRFLACVAYLDGVHPSVVFCRGYYTRTVLVAYEYKNKTLTQKWKFDTSLNGLSTYTNQGSHNLAVGDVDGDGYDEIVYGACCIDNDGTGLYTTGLKHGDAMHLSQMDPSTSGMQVWRCLEDNKGLVLTDAKTGTVKFKLTYTADVGRAMAADIDPNHAGFELWGTSITGIYDMTGAQISTKRPSVNFGSWWDGDLLRELLDGVKIAKWNSANSSTITLFDQTGVCLSNNTTKATPCLSADILGDWREEVILRSVNNDELRIYATTIPTTYRIYTLMHNPQYRESIAWQNVAYNQPPQTNYFFGDGMVYPPVQPDIVLVDPKNFPDDVKSQSEKNRPVHFGVEQNYPNPFNPATTIRYEVAVTGNINMKVCDIMGREITTLVNGYKTAGAYEITFNASELPSGIYFYTMKTENFIQTKKMLLLK